MTTHDDTEEPELGGCTSVKQSGSELILMVERQIAGWQQRLEPSDVAAVRRQMWHAPRTVTLHAPTLLHTRGGHLTITLTPLLGEN